MATREWIWQVPYQSESDQIEFPGEMDQIGPSFLFTDKTLELSVASAMNEPKHAHREPLHRVALVASDRDHWTVLCPLKPPQVPNHTL